MPPFASAVRSPRLEARVARGLYLLVIPRGGFAEIAVRGAWVCVGDPAATARRISAHEGLFHVGFAAERATNVVAASATLLFHRVAA